MPHKFVSLVIAAVEAVINLCSAALKWVRWEIAKIVEEVVYVITFATGVDGLNPKLVAHG